MKKYKIRDRHSKIHFVNRDTFCRYLHYKKKIRKLEWKLRVNCFYADFLTWYTNVICKFHLLPDEESAIRFRAKIEEQILKLKIFIDEIDKLDADIDRFEMTLQ